MANLNKSTLEGYIQLIDNNRDNFALVKSSYKSNIESVDSDLSGISFDYWEDDVATKFSEYKDYLSNGVVSKLKSSISENGTFNHLEKLIDDLYEKCESCLTFIDAVNNKYSNISMTNNNSTFSWYKEVMSSVEYAETHVYGEESECAELNRQLSDYYSAINDTLAKISQLKFDDVIDYEIASTPSYDVPPAEKREIICERIINQFDRVRISIPKEDGTLESKVMYYLGTDSKGRSYFSETLDDNCKVYRGASLTDLDTAQTWLNDTDKLGDPLLGSNYASARIGFVLTGGNTDDMTVKNILSYPNGAYTGDAAFNKSIQYDDSRVAPEIVERGNSQFATATTYHVVYLDNRSFASLDDVYGSNTVNFNTEHPDIVIKKGESITTKYGGILDLDFTKSKYTIGSNEEDTYLIWDHSKQRYYVVSGNGYSTSQEYMGSNHGRGYYYVTVDALRADDTVVKMN